MKIFCKKLIIFPQKEQDDAPFGNDYYLH